MTTNLFSAYPLLAKRIQKERILMHCHNYTQKARDLNQYINNQAQIANEDINPAPRKSVK